MSFTTIMNLIGLFKRLLTLEFYYYLLIKKKLKPLLQTDKILILSYFQYEATKKIILLRFKMQRRDDKKMNCWTMAWIKIMRCG